jgi:hypothetical protein
MAYKTKKRALNALRRLEKSGTDVMDGLTSNQPALYPGTNVVDNYRAREAADITDMRQKRFIDNLELSRRLFEIDNKQYGVTDDIAHKLLDYMEQHEFNVIQELEMEYSIKRKALKKKAEELAEMNMEDYLTEEDYKRITLFKIKQINVYQNRLQYIGLIIKTLKDYIRELKETEDLPGARNAVNDFSYNFTNYNNDFTSAGKMK